MFSDLGGLLLGYCAMAVTSLCSFESLSCLFLLLGVMVFFFFTLLVFPLVLLFCFVVR